MSTPSVIETANGARSVYALSEAELAARLKPPGDDRAKADAEFALAEYLYQQKKIADAIPHFKEAQRLAPDNWNYKRQALGSPRMPSATTAPTSRRSRQAQRQALLRTAQAARAQKPGQ